MTKTLFSKRPPVKKKMYTQKIGYILGGIILGCLLLYIGLYVKYTLDLQKTVSDVPLEKSVEISGSVSEIAHLLEEKEIIVSASSFIKYLQQEGLDTQIKKCDQKTLSAHQTIAQIANELLFCTAPTTTVRIPEGYTLQEIDTYLSKTNILEKGEFLDCIEKTCDFSEFSFLPKNRLENNLEGYFYPIYNEEIETKKLSAQAIANKSLEVFEQKAKKLGAFSDKKRSLGDLVIMASLIEKESSSYEGDESAMIADVLWKRIDEGIPLGVDATIRYVLGIKSSALTVTNLNMQNDFNTRKNRGLPPHAISSFSEHSLKAAIQPKENLYYYYLHYKKVIHYGKTNAEHEKNKQVYCGGSCE